MPIIDDGPPVCTCHRSALCLIHAPSGAPFGIDKHPVSVYIVLDVEVEKVELYPLEELIAVEHIEIQPTVYKTLEDARVAALQLVLDNLEKYGDPYSEIEDHEGLICIWENEWGDYVGIKELTFEE
jgi:hypothetical protein